MRGTDRLAGLLRQTVVQVVAEGRYGSGVLVAPGLLLTCAHVVAAGVETAVRVRWAGAEYPATVRYASTQAGHGGWAYPDLAVVELDQPPDGHPCAWLDQRWPSIGGQLLALGYSDMYRAGAVLHPALLDYDGPRPYGDGDSDLLQLAGREIGDGMSGGPVLNPATGGVCGLIKATRLPNAALGGLAIPARALRRADPQLYRRVVRAHDRFHAAGGDWAEAIDDLPMSAVELEPAEERDLRGLLAAFPVADDHADRLAEAGGRLCQARPGDSLVDYTDVVTELSELVPPRSGLPYVLGYAADLARDHTGAAGRALRDWVLLTAGRLRLGPAVQARLDGPAASSAPASVMVRLRPVANDRHRYRLTVWRYTDATDVVPAVNDQDPIGLDEVWRRLRELLPEQIDLLARRRSQVMVELFLPQHLMDADVDGWRLWPERQRWSTLGRQYPVLVRDGARLDDARLRSRWERRWDRLGDQGLDRLLEFIGCADARGHEELEGWIEPEETRSALVFASSPLAPAPRPALEVGLPAGIPVMIWRRSGCAGCPEPAGESCAGNRFFTGLRTALADVPVTELPERIRTLRNHASGSGSDDHCGHGIVLLCDDPRRRPPLDRMVFPEEGYPHG